MIWGTFYILYDGEVRLVVFAPPLGLVVVDSSADVALKKKQEHKTSLLWLVYCSSCSGFL